MYIVGQEFLFIFFAWVLSTLRDISEPLLQIYLMSFELFLSVI